MAAVEVRMTAMATAAATMTTATMTTAAMTTAAMTATASRHGVSGRRQHGRENNDGDLDIEFRHGTGIRCVANSRG
jgi:hypothetical protein